MGFPSTLPARSGCLTTTYGAIFCLAAARARDDDLLGIQRHRARLANHRRTPGRIEGSAHGASLVGFVIPAEFRSLLVIEGFDAAIFCGIIDDKASFERSVLSAQSPYLGDEHPQLLMRGVSPRFEYIEIEREWPHPLAAHHRKPRDPVCKDKRPNAWRHEEVRFVRFGYTARRCVIHFATPRIAIPYRLRPPYKVQSNPPRR